MAIPQDVTNGLEIAFARGAYTRRYMGEGELAFGLT
jgi:hypothetical protein